MKPKTYEVMRAFKGSPDGRFSVDYEKGAAVPLTDSLALVAVAEGWVKELETVTSIKKTAPRKKVAAKRKSRKTNQGN